MAAPKNLLDLHNQLIDQAKKFGFDESRQHGQLRDCIYEKSSQTIRSANTDEKNYWFGFIREGEPTSKAYEGLSFVVFPEANGSHCVASIGIGSSTTAEGSFSGGSLGPDMELAMKLSFVRSFRSLQGKVIRMPSFSLNLTLPKRVAPRQDLKKRWKTRTLYMIPRWLTPWLYMIMKTKEVYCQPRYWLTTLPTMVII